MLHESLKLSCHCLTISEAMLVAAEKQYVNEESSGLLAGLFSNRMNMVGTA
jgi:hypothetical protein